MSKSLESVSELNFEVIKEYINGGSSVALSTEYKKMLDICLDCYALLKKYPQRNVCIRRLMIQQGLSYNTAAKYVDFARNTWGSYVDLKRDFLETFFVEKILEEISDKDASESSRAKNLATLQKHLENMPEQRVDPKLMEKNTVLIQVNINGRMIPLPERLLERIPMDVRQEFLSALSGEVDDDTSVKLLES